MCVLPSRNILINRPTAETLITEPNWSISSDLKIVPAFLDFI